MAGNKTPKLLEAGKWHPSLKRLLIFGSVTLNIGFIVLFLTLSFTNKLDGMFMPVGLDRYCSASNDDKFSGSTDQVKAVRGYVCDSPDAHMYFQEGLSKYLQAKGLPRSTE